MELTKELKTIFIETAQELKGYASRIFKAKVVKGLGKGGQRRAEEELGWNRGTIQDILCHGRGYTSRARQHHV